MIELQDVEVVFGAGTPLEKHALRGLSVTLQDGEFVTVIGSNGAGKSTLLGVLAGAVGPTRGALRVDGRDVSAQNEEERAALVARVFQDPMAGTCAALTIEENLALAARRGSRRGLRLALNATSRDVFQRMVQPLGLGLERRLQTQIGTLSGGQRQAVSLLMASLAGSRLLLLDEHTAALDPGTAALVMRQTEELVGGRRLTTLMVTHSMQHALTHGSRTLMLDGGQLVLDIQGRQREGLRVPDLLQLFSKARSRPVDEDRLLAV